MLWRPTLIIAKWRNWYTSALRFSLPRRSLSTAKHAYFRGHSMPSVNLTSVPRRSTRCGMARLERVTSAPTVFRSRSVPRDCCSSGRVLGPTCARSPARAEGLVAATALNAAGFNVLLTDATAVFHANPLPFFASKDATIALFLQRDSYPQSMVMRSAAR